ncbi:MAG: hypothetical protein O8C58_01340, partial [Candidatus Methanoperedens sp.]|nr:hypothetical protein [Candidatus Methanoperedens sp.]
MLTTYSQHGVPNAAPIGLHRRGNRLFAMM